MVGGDTTVSHGGRSIIGRGGRGGGIKSNSSDEVTADGNEATGNGGDGAAWLSLSRGAPGSSGSVTIGEIDGVAVGNEIEIVVGSGGAKGATASTSGTRAMNGGPGRVVIVPVY